MSIFNFLTCYNIIAFKPAINCEWGQWIIGNCSKTCGNGTKTNKRTKIVKEEHGGTCTGEHTESEECNTQECPGIHSR